MKKNMLRVGIVLTALLLLTGCPQPNTPQKSTDATLSSLSVVGYATDKTFSSDTTAYSVVVEKTVSTVSVSTATTDSNASASWDKVPASTTLAAGPNVFTLTVTAEDGATTKTYTVTVYKANASVEVLDSVNGSKVAIGGTIYVYSSGSLLYSVALAANPQPVWLGADSVYTVKATPTGRAQSSKEDIVGADDLKLTMISQRLDQSSFPAESPTINSLAYTTSAAPADPSTLWTTIASGDTIDFSTITYVRLIASGKSEMDETSWAGFGMMLGIDQVPSTFSGYFPDASLSSSTYDSTSGLFTGTAIFNCSGLSITSGSHVLSIVIYDRTNNRVERNLTVTNSLANTSGSDISADYFQSLTADLRIYGVSREYFGKEASSDGLAALSSGSISYRAAVSFMFQTAAGGGSAVPILGFKVFRSEDAGLTWTNIGAVNYGGLSTGSGAVHTFYDTDSQLTTGVAYQYKITVFTDDVHLKESSPTSSVQFLPPFTASLSGPANKTKVLDASNLPAFEFTISDPSLWDASLSDRFYFAPVIRKADGTVVYWGYLSYRFSDSTLGFYWRANSNYYAFDAVSTAGLISFDAATGKVSLDPSLFNFYTNYATGADLALESGVTYYWDIFGNYTGNTSTNTASYFQKSGIGYITRSFADVYQNGQQTLNGWYSFTVQ